MPVKQDKAITSSASLLRVLSLDVPWGGARFVGAAFAGVREGQFEQGPSIASVDTGRLGDMNGLPPLPVDDPEIAGFIADGVGPGRVSPADIYGPFAPHRPGRAERTAYLTRIWRVFHVIRDLLELANLSMDLVLVDIPVVPAQIVHALPLLNRTMTYRPVEQAMGSKVLIPGNSAKRAEGRIQFPRFQPGVHNGHRPGYAIISLAQRVFDARIVCESFPQLLLGPLCEFAAHYQLPLIQRLADHKTGGRQRRLVGQFRLAISIEAFLGQPMMTWYPENMTVVARSDAYDALLGLLPGLVRAGYSPPGPADAPWRRAIGLQNAGPGFAPPPQSQGAGNPCVGSQPWIQVNPALADGICDTVILCLDLDLWQ